MPDGSDHAEQKWPAFERHGLNHVDRQLMLLYLEDMDAAYIAEIVGISTNNVRVQTCQAFWKRRLLQEAILRSGFHQ